MTREEVPDDLVAAGVSVLDSYNPDPAGEQEVREILDSVLPLYALKLRDDLARAAVSEMEGLPGWVYMFLQEEASK